MYDQGAKYQSQIRGNSTTQIQVTSIYFTNRVRRHEYFLDSNGKDDKEAWGIIANLEKMKGIRSYNITRDMHGFCLQYSVLRAAALARCSFLGTVVALTAI